MFLSTESNFFLDNLPEAFDIYSKHYENICIFSNFNVIPEKNDMISFISYDQFYFKSANGSMIDLFLSTNKYLFQKANSFETGITDHHHLIATVIQKTYERSPPKFLVC